MNDQLERTGARFRPRTGESNNGEITRRVTAAAFRAAVEERLRNLERDIGELKGRLNGLIFVVIGAVVTQLVLNVVE